MSEETIMAVQQVPPATPPVATDISSIDINAFIAALPRDTDSDLPIRVVGVSGDYRIGVYGVYRPQESPGAANLHRTSTTEIYYILSGQGTLVTGGTLIDPKPKSPTSVTLKGTGIEGGVSRDVGAGDVVIIPGYTPHWWSALDSNLSHLIIRTDPDNRLELHDA